MEEIKEEAQRIIELFQPYCQEYQEGTDMYFIDNKEDAKQCALIYFEGIITSLSKIQESQGLSIDSVRCVTKEIKNQIKVKEYIQKNY